MADPASPHLAGSVRSAAAGVLAALFVLAVGAFTVHAIGPASADDAPAEARTVTHDHRETVEIECGGYDADGDLVSAEAAEIDRVPVDEYGAPAIPGVCGGYTADGEFIGDD